MENIIEYLKHRSQICEIESRNEPPIIIENESIDLFQNRMIEKSNEFKMAANILLLFMDLQKWAGKYEFSFQFWGPGSNHGWIRKDDVELFTSFDNETILECLQRSINYLNRINTKR